MVIENKNITGSNAGGMKRKWEIIGCLGVTVAVWLCLLIVTGYWTARLQRHTDQSQKTAVKLSARIHDGEWQPDPEQRLLALEKFGVHSQEVSTALFEAQRSYEQLVWIICIGAISFNLLALGMLLREKRAEKVLDIK